MLKTENKQHKTKKMTKTKQLYKRTFFLKYHAKPAYMNVNKRGKTNNQIIQKRNQQTMKLTLK